MARSKVDFPAPDVPASAKCCPGSTVKETLCKPVTVRPSMLCSTKLFVRSRTSRMGLVAIAVLMLVPPIQVSGCRGDADLQAVDRSMHFLQHDRGA